MMPNKDVCPVCGEPTYLVYGKHPRKDGLCYKHSQMLFNKEIELCPDCGKWHKANMPCECKNIATKNINKDNKTLNPNINICPTCGKLVDIKFHICKNKPSSENITETNNQQERKVSEEIQVINDLTCIICGKPSNGKHFCFECYKKYKTRSVDIRITNCTETKIIDDYGNLTYKCNDGRKVRSRAEKIISDELFNLQVLSIYEETINYYPNETETIELHPDFYLPKYELYIEYNELKNKPYLKSKEYTQKIYAELNKKVVIMTEKDLEDVKSYLKKLLKIN